MVQDSSLNVSTDWEIKYLPRHVYHGLIYFRDKYYKYKLKGRDSSKLKSDYVNKLFTLYFTVETYFTQYLEKSDEENLPDPEEYEALSEFPLPDSKQIRRLEKCLIKWLYTEGYFKTTEKPKKVFDSIEAQYEEES